MFPLFYFVRINIRFKLNILDKKSPLSNKKMTFSFPSFGHPAGGKFGCAGMRASASTRADNSVIPNLFRNLKKQGKWMMSRYDGDNG